MTIAKVYTVMNFLYPICNNYNQEIPEKIKEYIQIDEIGQTDNFYYIQYYYYLQIINLYHKDY